MDYTKSGRGYPDRWKGEEQYVLKQRNQMGNISHSVNGAVTDFSLGEGGMYPHSDLPMCFEILNEEFTDCIIKNP